MNANYQLLCRILVFLICLLAVPWAQAATFAINFFDQNNKRVGEGQFMTDPSRTICVEVHPLGGCGDNPRMPVVPGGPNQYDFGYVVDRQNPLTSFSATIQSISWGFEAGNTWWKADGQLPGSQGVSRAGPSLNDGFWFFGDPFFGFRQLAMPINTNQATDSSASGSWVQSVQFDQKDNPLPQPVFGSGSWTASVVPVPAALWLFVSGLGALGVFRRKKYKS